MSDGGLADNEWLLTHLFHYVWWENSGCKGTSENIRKFLVQAADAHFLKIPVWADDGLTRISCLGFSCVGGHHGKERIKTLVKQYTKACKKH